MSELNELAAALAKAQGEILPAPKDADNPFFKSKYASLPAVREAVREVFAKNGLSVVQMPSVEGGHLHLKTLLLHSSGQTLDCGTLTAEVDLSNPQKAGSAITYFRRYALAAISQTVADEDDDAEAAKKATRGQPKAQPLSGKDVVALQQAITAANTPKDITNLLRGQHYSTLKASGPKDVYEQTKKLAETRHALLTSEVEG